VALRCGCGDEGQPRAHLTARATMARWKVEKGMTQRPPDISAA
jgi:hypothetical protein